jgi:hypothetical protein
MKLKTKVVVYSSITFKIESKLKTPSLFVEKNLIIELLSLLISF